ncbi:MAG: hypothetical protein Q9215_004398 [Flavoplaca cf. flavocitrina]
MSSPGAWKSSIIPNAAFEPASLYILRQKDVPALRDYNRQLTEAYESVLMERDAFKRKNISLQRDVRELESALDASGRPATVGPSEDLRSAQSKIAELESALAQARLDLNNKDREIMSLQFKLHTADQSPKGTRGSLELDHDKSHQNEKTEPADGDGRFSSPSESHFQVVTPGDRPHDYDSDMGLFESASESDPPVRAQAPMESGRSSVLASSFPGQPSSLVGRLAQTSLSPTSDRPRSFIPQTRLVRKRKEARQDSISPSPKF